MTKSRRTATATCVGIAITIAMATSVVVGCGSDPKVVRVYDGRIVDGPFVPSEAYASYLKGVLAEEAGDLKSALAAYEQAVREDDEDPEPFTRIGDVRCRLSPSMRGAADDAFAKALKLDKTYAPALAAQARCAAASGQTAQAVALAERGVAEDGTNPSMESLFVQLAAQRTDAAAAADRRARERAIALTLASGERPVAWDALITWGRAKSDPELLAKGLENLVRVAPLRSGEVEAGALELLGIGQTGLARRVAASITDAPAALGVVGPRDPTVARLAVDEAILRSDLARAERRATRGHVPLSEVAARALILERPELAASIARSVIGADPNAGGASMVLAAIAAREGKPPPPTDRMRGKEPPTDRPSAACVLVLAERIAALGNAESARAWAARVAPSPMAPHDPVTGPLAVDLAARGVLAPTALPLELRLELAARRREPPPAVEAAALDQPNKPGGVDQKHALLWHVLVDPAGTPARSLLKKMQNAADGDPIIGFALARAAIATLSPQKSEMWAPVFRAIAAAPAHPLLLAAAVDIAKKGGRAEDVPPARARLMAVARTPAERALAGE